MNAMKHIILSFCSALLAAGCMTTYGLEQQGIRAYSDRNYETAYKNFSRSVEYGREKAKYHLAVMFAEGNGVEQDYKKAAQLLNDAAKAGSSDAELMLGLFYVQGDGVAQNPEKGFEFISAAAKKDNDVAMYYLGHLYASGIGVKQNFDTALEWMEKAKENGFPVKEELLTTRGLRALY